MHSELNFFFISQYPYLYISNLYKIQIISERERERERERGGSLLCNIVIFVYINYQLCVSFSIGLIRVSFCAVNLVNPNSRIYAGVHVRCS